MIEAMNRARALEPSSFVPNKLLDTLIEKMNLKNDAELCRVLEVQPPIISKIRHRKLAVGATILLRMHEKSDMSIRDLEGIVQLVHALNATASCLAAKQPIVKSRSAAPSSFRSSCSPFVAAHPEPVPSAINPAIFPLNRF
ncbi:hypothetical protein LP420_03670 [Massilia sp. B-10]|nr:hypothetical protein LP420_03670 [Massilia sp. B-10]